MRLFGLSRLTSAGALPLAFDLQLDGALSATPLYIGVHHVPDALSSSAPSILAAERAARGHAPLLTRHNDEERAARKGVASLCPAGIKNKQTTAGVRSRGKGVAAVWDAICESRGGRAQNNNAGMAAVAEQYKAAAVTTAATTPRLLDDGTALEFAGGGSCVAASLVPLAPLVRGYPKEVRLDMPSRDLLTSAVRLSPPDPGKQSLAHDIVARLSSGVPAGRVESGGGRRKETGGGGLGVDDSSRAVVAARGGVRGGKALSAVREGVAEEANTCDTPTMQHGDTGTGAKGSQAVEMRGRAPIRSHQARFRGGGHKPEIRKPEYISSFTTYSARQLHYCLLIQKMMRGWLTRRRLRSIIAPPPSPHLLTRNQQVASCAGRHGVTHGHRRSMEHPRRATHAAMRVHSVVRAQSWMTEHTWQSSAETARAREAGDSDAITPPAESVTGTGDGATVRPTLPSEEVSVCLRVTVLGAAPAASLASGGGVRAAGTPAVQAAPACAHPLSVTAEKIKFKVPAAVGDVPLAVTHNGLMLHDPVLPDGGSLRDAEQVTLGLAALQAAFPSHCMELGGGGKRGGGRRGAVPESLNSPNGDAALLDACVNTYRTRGLPYHDPAYRCAVYTDVYMHDTRVPEGQGGREHPRTFFQVFEWDLTKPLHRHLLRNGVLAQVRLTTLAGDSAAIDKIHPLRNAFLLPGQAHMAVSIHELPRCDIAVRAQRPGRAQRVHLCVHRRGAPRRLLLQPLSGAVPRRGPARPRRCPRAFRRAAAAPGAGACAWLAMQLSLGRILLRLHATGPRHRGKWGWRRPHPLGLQGSRHHAAVPGAPESRCRQVCVCVCVCVCVRACVRACVCVCVPLKVTDKRDDGSARTESKEARLQEGQGSAGWAAKWRTQCSRFALTKPPADFSRELAHLV